MAKTNALNIYQIEQYVKLDTSLRLILDYLPQTDTIITRIDVKIENRQYCVGVTSSYPKEPIQGQAIRPDDDLITPKNAVEACLNIKVNKKVCVFEN